MTTSNVFESHFHLLPGASLYYKILGPENKHLPFLVIVPATTGSTFFFEALATHLSTCFRVLLYDRRGYNRSHAEKALLATEHNLFQAHAEDLAALIEHVSPPAPGSQTPEPIHLFTSSASTAIVLELLMRKPHIIRKVVIHDPVLLSLSGESISSYFRRIPVITEARRGNFVGANAMVSKHLYTSSEWKLFRSSEVALHAAKNVTRRDLAYYFQTELAAIRSYEPDLRRLAEMLPCPGEKVVIVQGRDEAPELARVSGVKLADIMRVPIEGIVGGHVGYVTHVREFADELLGFLRPSRVSRNQAAKF